MSLSELGDAENDEILRQPRGAMPRVMASLFFAFFAYLGLTLGGGFGTLASTETNSFSAARGGQQQPHVLTARDATRGIVAAERNVEPKASWFDGNAALAAPVLNFAFANEFADAFAVIGSLPVQSPDKGAYLARGPPKAA